MSDLTVERAVATGISCIGQSVALAIALWALSGFPGLPR